MNEIQFHDWGKISYGEAYQKQAAIFNLNVSRKLQHQDCKMHMVFCEHTPVITLGKSAKNENLLFPEEWLKVKGVEVYKTDRGGDITFHGPGQLVMYPLLDLDQLQIGVKEFVSNIEQSVVRLLSDYGITASPYHGYTGVWMAPGTPEERKLAAIGIRCSRGITMHGMAMNVNTDLKYFNYIVPCGIQGKAVSSISKELGREIDFEALKTNFKSKLMEVFQCEFV
jgi:lipoyl(octanoyl) transferase